MEFVNETYIYMYLADKESLESPIFLKSALHLLNQKECGYLNPLLELIKTVVEKGKRYVLICVYIRTYEYF